MPLPAAHIVHQSRPGILQRRGHIVHRFTLPSPLMSASG